VPSLSKNWGAPGPPLVSRFQYSLFDDPEIIRFYPPIAKDTTDPDLLAGALYEQLTAIGGQMVTVPIMERVRQSVAWLLGGPMSPDLRRGMARDPAALGTVASGMATRAIRQGMRSGTPIWNDSCGCRSATASSMSTSPTRPTRARCC
jgi:hypothetical protein